MDGSYPGLWTFRHHPWLKDPHDSKSEVTTAMKGAQLGFTEWAINVESYYLDILKKDVLHVLPNTRPDAADFSAGRFDKAVELSEHMKAMFTDVQNVGHKRAGACNLYIRGSNSRSGLMSLPVGLLILDELNEMDQKNVPLALQRLKGQRERTVIKISTPTIPDTLISEDFNDGTQEEWFFPCPSCSRHITLKHENLVVVGEHPSDPRVMSESYIKCTECDAKLHHEDKVNFINRGGYVAAHPNRLNRSFHINQLFAMHLVPGMQAIDWLKGQRDESYEQVYWNATMGLPFVAANAQITLEMINLCIGDYNRVDYNRYPPVTMGVDQGKRIHCEIDLWEIGPRSGYDVNTYSRCKVLNHVEVDNFEDLDRLMFQYGVNFCVIDSQPERRKALEFANRFPGRVKLCRYPTGVNGRNVTVASDEELTVNVDRTSWLDMSLGRFRNGTITIPRNTTQEYKDHISAQVRVAKKDQWGHIVNRYETLGNRQDHYGHARNYAEIALPFALGIGTNQGIG